MPSISTPIALDEKLRNGAHLVISLSGGKDSEAMLWALLGVRAAWGDWTGQVHLVHADLGSMERSETPAYVESLAKRTGLPLHIVRANRELIEMFEARFEQRPDVVPFSDAKNRFCTSDGKRGPIDKWMRQQFPEDAEVICAIGLRADESAARAKKPVWRERPNASAPTKNRFVYDWHPILDWSAEDVWSVIRMAKSEGHPAYAKGNERLSCGMCILGCQGDIRNGAHDKPEVYRRLCALEIKSGKSYQQGKWLGAVAPHLLTEEQYAWYQAKGIIK